MNALRLAPGLVPNVAEPAFFAVHASTAAAQPFASNRRRFGISADHTRERRWGVALCRAGELLEQQDVGWRKPFDQDLERTTATQDRNVVAGAGLRTEREHRGRCGPCRSFADAGDVVVEASAADAAGPPAGDADHH